MKKLLAGLFALGVCTALAGCNRSKMPELEEGEKWIVHENTEIAETAYAAKTLQELYEHAAFVAEVKITDTTTTLNAGLAMLSTDAELEVLHLYKGEYNGEVFHFSGGYMRLSEYAERVTWQDFSKYSKEEMEYGYVCDSVFHEPIPETGDTLLLFCALGDEAVVYPDSPGQSMYLCDGNAIRIDSMVSEGAFTDPLALDLQENYNATLEYNDNHTVSVTCDRETLLAALSE